MDFVIFDVSMLHHLTVSDSMIERHKDRVYRIPYSDHSSRDEILEFLKQFCFSSVVPTSKPITEKDLKIMIECTRESSATFAHSEGKLVIENEDEAGVEMEMANQENGRKNDDVDKIVEKTKSMGVQRQTGPLDSTPLPPNRDDLDYTIREQHVLGSTLEAMLESAAPPGILTDDDGTPGPSGVDLHPLNLELEMDLSEMGIGLDLPTTPSPLLASSQYPRHSRPRHLHQHLQLNNHLSSEIDDAIVQRAEEQHRNLHMRLNSPEEQQLETLHLSQERHSSSKNRWNQKTPEKQFQNGVFSPLYTQEMVEVEKNQSALDPVIEQPDGSETPSPSIALPNSILEQDGEKMEEDVVPEPEPESQNPNENEPTSSVQNPEEAMEKELSVSNENALKEAEKVPVAEEEVCEKSEDVFKGQEDTPVEEDVPEEVPIQENAPEEAEAVPIEVDHAPEEAENVSNIESEAVPMEEDVNFEEGEEEEDNPMDEAILEPEDVTPEEPEAAEKELDQEHEKTPELEEEPQQEEQRPEEEEVADSEPEPADDFTRMEQPEEEEVENLEILRIEKKPIVKNVKEVENDEDQGEDDEDDDDYDFDPNLDNWSEGPPRTLKEAIARLQYRSSSSQRRRQHAL
uniref:DRMBL domain-containing protein n=1 Tax=Caenorhabditis japonica TaxID=281687 RepID=A0A8R1HG25_CAEJA